jgi:hypothetical protein
VNLRYNAFGLTFSSNLELSGVVPEQHVLPTLSVWFKSRPSLARQTSIDSRQIYVSPFQDTAGRSALRIHIMGGYEGDRIYWHLDFADGMEFWFDERAEIIWSDWPHGLTPRDAEEYLLGPVFGLILRLRGFSCLHASAVVANSRAILLAGDSGAGKSTTAAAMAERGHAILSDDLVPIVRSGDRHVALPAYPYVSLWPESKALLRGSPSESEAITSSFEKQRLLLGGLSLPFQSFPLPIGAIFNFGERQEGSLEHAIQRLAGREGLLALLGNSYIGPALTAEMRAREFKVFAEVAEMIPIYRLQPHLDLRKLEQLCEAIETRCAWS